jgi:hypothetical protein
MHHGHCLPPLSPPGRLFAQHLGVNVDTLLLCQPDSGEMALEVADSLIRWGGVRGWGWGWKGRTQDPRAAVCAWKGAGPVRCGACERVSNERQQPCVRSSTIRAPVTLPACAGHAHNPVDASPPPPPRVPRSSAIDMVAVDSVAALVPRAELEGEIGQTQGGPPPPLPGLRALSARSWRTPGGPRNEGREADLQAMCWSAPESGLGCKVPQGRRPSARFLPPCCVRVPQWAPKRG